ncbi:protein-disulfide reductase DsbD [Paludibacterium purpuratum]|uniref:Thiol:disulfide interchange protein DsbD n=1 Tax=Paludibacterium purpuratum TaxID=1144873 RepID=A0A4R7BCX6_9NEIS|nr:protein-disulfide reductase DsbD [Paludibacterium purpuratum]TDR82012.1 thiol:disulfide interchange protein DsbD [Paludibacterium purpuratum]
MKYRHLFWFVPLILLSLILVCRPAAALSPNDLLRPEKAFATSVQRAGDQLILTLNVADGYYVYRDRMQLASDPAGLLEPVRFPAGTVKNDPYFGTQVIFEHQNRIVVPLKPGAPERFSLSVRLQGCAKVGVCYPPYTRKLIVGEGAAGAWTTAWQGAAPTPAGAPAQTLPLTLLAFFAAGIGMAFTACMYPLLPILTSLIAGQGATLTRRRGFSLAFAYVQGLALTYTAVGVVAGLTGALLTVWLQRPEVVLTASALMVLLALSMFGLFSIQLPSALQSRLAASANRLPGGRLLSVALMGAVSALIIGPCVAPPLALALGYIGSTGDAWLGGLALYLMALGLGLPLLLIGTFGGHVLPRAGRWMNAVKSVFGVVMLAAAISMAAPFLPGGAVLALWGMLLVGSAVFLRAFDGLSPNAHGLARLGKALGLVLFLVGAAELFGALAGEKDPRYPLSWLMGRPAEAAAELPPFVPVGDVQALDRQLGAQSGRPAILDFYADWCVSCKEMDDTTWRDAGLRAQLTGFTLLRADVTQNSAAHAGLLSRFGLYGPPGIILFDASGHERDRIIGYIDAAALKRRLAVVQSAG